MAHRTAKNKLVTIKASVLEINLIFNAIAFLEAMQGQDSEDSTFTEDVDNIKVNWNKMAERNKFVKDFKFKTTQ
jgi:hypothetical protein